MHDGCATKADLKTQSDRHHDALTRITEVLGGIQRDQKTTLEHLVGTWDKPGYGVRIAAIEEKQRLSLWQEAKITLLRSVIQFSTVSLLFGGVYMALEYQQEKKIRQVIEEVTMARKAPKDPSCPGCAPTVADAR
jgi:hypothetical protein